MSPSFYLYLTEQNCNIQMTLNIRDEFHTLLLWSWCLSIYPQNKVGERPWCSHLLRWTPWIRSPVKLDRVMLMNCISWKSGLLMYLGTVVREVTNVLQCFSSFEAEHPEEILISEQNLKEVPCVHCGRGRLGGWMRRKGFLGDF